MKEKHYNKLVRDRIPEIIKGDGNVPVTRILNSEEYEEYLKKKLQEELAEFLEAESLEEFCDILEVIEALADAKGFTEGDIKEVKAKKVAKNGAFKEKIFLEKVVIK